MTAAPYYMRKPKVGYFLLSGLKKEFIIELKVSGATIAVNEPESVSRAQYCLNSSEAGKFAKNALLPDPGPLE